MQTIVYHSKARKTMCGMGTFCLIGMISFQLTMQNGEFELTNIKSISFRSTITTGWLLHISIETNDSHVLVVGFDRTRGVIAYIDGAEIWEITPV